MQRDGFLFQGPYDMANAFDACKIALVFWLLGLALVGYLIYLRRDKFQPQEYFTDNLLAVLGNLVLFSLLVFLQLAVESLLLWGDKPVYSLQDMTRVNLWPWIIGHMVAGAVLLMIAVAVWGRKQMDTLILYSAIPITFPFVGMVYLGMLWWPSLFSFPMMSAVVMVSQTAVIGILTVPLGLLAIWFVILGPLRWALD